MAILQHAILCSYVYIACSEMLVVLILHTANIVIYDDNIDILVVFGACTKLIDRLCISLEASL